MSALKILKPDGDDGGETKAARTKVPQATFTKAPKMALSERSS